MFSWSGISGGPRPARGEYPVWNVAGTVKELSPWLVLCDRVGEWLDVGS